MHFQTSSVYFLPFLAFLVIAVVPQTHGYREFIEKLRKLDFVPPAEPDIFPYVCDDGDLVIANLTGGPSPATKKDCESGGVEFFLLVSGKGNEEVPIFPNCTDCLETFVSGAKVVVISHGFGSSSKGSFGSNYRYALAHQNETFNVIFVNWQPLAKVPWYKTAADNVRPVGEYTATLLNFLVDQKLTSLDRIHFVGHSLGSHVGNYVGRNVNGGKIARITALDPALPLFADKSDDERIDPSDANLVVVIHTSALNRSLGPMELGLAFAEPRGHVDFYPNSGKNQPACSILQDFMVGACSHSMANVYFAESMNRTSAFVGYECDSWEDFEEGHCACDQREIMGWTSYNSLQRGIYYLQTGEDSPYGMGDSGCPTRDANTEPKTEL